MIRSGDTARNPHQQTEEALYDLLVTLPKIEDLIPCTLSRLGLISSAAILFDTSTTTIISAPLRSNLSTHIPIVVVLMRTNADKSRQS